MKIIIENRYEDDDSLIEEFVKKVALKNSRLLSLILGVTGFALVGYSLAQKQMLMVWAFAALSCLMFATRFLFPTLLVKSIKKNNHKETGGGENLFQFGRVIHVEQGESKTDIEYDMLGKFTELKGGYVFKLGKLSYLVLKKGCFTLGTWAQLKKLIGEKRPDLKMN